MFAAPAPTGVSVAPFGPVQVNFVLSLDANDTGSPELDVATSLNAGAVCGTLAGVGNVIVWFSLTIVELNVD